MEKSSIEIKKTLYDITKDIFDAKNDEEARSILFGSDLLSTMNREDYYNSVVSNFVKKKELIIEKKSDSTPGKDYLEFNLEKNVSNLWNVIFLGCYVLKKWEGFINLYYHVEENPMMGRFHHPGHITLSNFLCSGCLGPLRNPNITDDQIIVLKNTIYSVLNDIEHDIIQIEKNYDDIHSIDKKEKLFSINGIIQRIKVILGPKDSVEISRIGKKDEYGKNLQDYSNELSKKLKDILLPYEDLLIKVNNLFARISNNNINYSFKFDNEINDLKKMIIIVHRLRNAIEHRNDSYMYDNDFILIDDEKLIIKMPICYLEGFYSGRILARDEDKSVVDETNRISHSILKMGGYDSKKMDSFFYNIKPENIKILLDYFGNDFQIIYNLPSIAFNVPYGTIDLFNELKSIFVLDKAKEIIMNLSLFAFYDTNKTILLFKMLLQKVSEEQVIKILSEASYGAFIEPTKTVFLLECLIDYDSEKAVDLITKLPVDAFKSPFKTISVIKTLKNCDVNYIVKKYNNKSRLAIYNKFDSSEKSSLLSFLKERCNKTDLENVRLNISKQAFIKHDIAIKIFKFLEKKFINFKTIDIFSKLPSFAFNDVTNTINILSYLSEKYGDDRLIEVLPYLPPFAFNGISRVKDFMQFLESSNRNCDALDFLLKVPYIAFGNINQLKKMYLFLIYNCSESSWFEILCNIPDKVWKAIDCLNFNNFLLLLKKLDYQANMLDKFPIEFFTCDAILLTEMLKNYDYSLSRSIFGVNNPKIISLMVYMNSVFSRLDVEKLPGENDSSINYQLLLDDEIDYFSSLQSNNFGVILRKIRNSTCHFRVSTKDKEGKPLEYNKIRLYDESFENGKVIENFELILLMEDALNITRKIEEMINLNKSWKLILEQLKNDSEISDYCKVQFEKILNQMKMRYMSPSEFPLGDFIPLVDGAYEKKV